MKQDEKRILRVLYVIGIIPIIWIALLLAPYTKGGLIEIIKNGSVALNQLERIIGGEKKMVQPNGARQRN